ncbi:MAG: FHA domain-containing protein [Planctomycetes bacterium]|nr:FHA domain-containing protein [Planctomycetota bacterium]
MAQYVLEILDGDRAGDVLPLSDRPLRIGRKPGNDLVLHDEKTSGVHAEIVGENDRHVLRDLGSTNGTFLDGRRITEIVLTPGDTVMLGRVRVKYRGAGSAAAADGDLAVHRLDASRVPKRAGALGLLAALLVLGLLAGGYLWWQGRTTGAGDGAPRPARTEPIVLAGNKVAQALAACEAEEGWNLRAAGAGFQVTSRAHTGSGGFEAARGAVAEAPDFAVATLQQPLSVLGGRTLTVQAFARTEGDGSAAVRAAFFAANEQNPFRFRSGAPPQQFSGWKAIDAVLAVPPGCDRMQLELVALLPAPGAAVVFDDVAVIEAGAAQPTELRLEESKQTAIGTFAALAVRSTDADNPATLLGVLPARVRSGLAGLHAAGFGALSDVGVRWSVQASERSFAIAAEGAEALQLVFPAEAAASVLVRREASGPFEPAAAEAPGQAQAVLLGDRATRALVQFAAPVACSARLGGGLYRLEAGAPAAELVLGFRNERLQAGELLRQAQRHAQADEPGQALAALRGLAAAVPHDSEMLAEAQRRRATLLAAQAEAIRVLQEQLAEATFFDTRGGFARVVDGLDEVRRRHGEENLEDAPAVAALRAAARRRLDELDAALHGNERARLEELGKALDESRLGGLAGLVRDYCKRHLGK